MAISYHTYQYGIETNIYFSTFQIVLVLYSLEISKLSYVEFLCKLDLNLSIMPKFVNYTKIPT